MRSLPNIFCLNRVDPAAASAPAARVATVLGTMSIPNPLDVSATREALDYFAKAGFEDIDTAIMYQGGKSEGALGEREAVAPACAAVVGVPVVFEIHGFVPFHI